VSDAPRLGELIGTLPPGATVAIGGAGLQRKPMALVRALAASGATNLRVVSYLGSVDVDYLIASGVVGEVHSAGVSLDGFGLAPAFRNGRQEASITNVEWSEGSLAAALLAAGQGLDSMAAGTSPNSDIIEANPSLRVAPDPFTGNPTVYAAAMPIDLCLLHLSAVDAAGNGYITGDAAADQIMARAAVRTVATADHTIEDDPARAAIPRMWLTETAVVGNAAWPSGSHPASLIDLAALTRWAGSGGDDITLLEAPS
jgi:glutaconate CoA-transferase subunit A